MSREPRRRPPPPPDLDAFLNTLDHVLTRLRAADLAQIDHAAGRPETTR